MSANNNLLIKIIKLQPLQLVLVAVLAIISNNLLSDQLLSFFYSLSITIKELLIFIIPFIVFSSIFFAFRKIINGSLFFVLILVAMVILSNFASALLGGFVGLNFIEYFGHSNNIEIIDRLSNTTNGIVNNVISSESKSIPLMWEFQLPRMIDNKYALLLAFILAFLVKNKTSGILLVFAGFIKSFSNIFLKRIFMPLLPLFIFGFVLNLVNNQLGSKIIYDHFSQIILMVGLMVGYTVMWYVIAVIITKKKFFEMLKNMSSALVTAFCTMSSSITLPFAITAAEKNVKKVEIARSVMPSIINIHMIGDAISLPLTALIVINICGYSMPSVSQYLVFSCFFVLMKFSGAGVPGGSVIVMAPILEQYLGFNFEMIAITTIINMFLDAINTTCNVAGNSIFVVLFDRIYSWVGQKKLKQSPEA